MLTLPADVISMIEEGNLTAGQVRPLIGLINASEIAEEVVSKKLSSRSVELLIREQKGPQKPGYKIDSNIFSEQKKIEEILGVKVNIRNKNNNSGRIIIEYKDLEQFEFISNLLKNR